MEEKIMVATIGKETYRTELKARNHKIIADEPEDVGGSNLGPQPGDFLRMSLASCTAITLRMYANRKNFDVEQIQVEVSTTDEEGRTLFNTSVKIIGHLTEDQRTRMLQIAKLCPVHKVLTSPIEVVTSLVVNS